MTDGFFEMKKITHFQIMSRKKICILIRKGQGPWWGLVGEAPEILGDMGSLKAQSLIKCATFLTRICFHVMFHFELKRQSFSFSITKFFDERIIKNEIVDERIITSFKYHIFIQHKLNLHLKVIIKCKITAKKNAINKYK